MNNRPTWLNEEPLQQLFAATRAAGGEARAVGGAVRDFLMARAGGDVDIASTLTPEETIALAKAHGWKAIPTGIVHGTVTLVLPGRVVEVTTLRRDVKTDGRHAVVAYTNRFEEDAARRDFTFNALYMDDTGTIHDYFDGQKDLAARVVRFIGDASTRITEDGLRILRYFRFLATHGSLASTGDLEAIKEKRTMIAQLSGERIATEMGKLLAAREPLYAITQMAECELAPLLSDTQWNVSMLQQLLQHEAQHKSTPLPWVRLFAMITPAAREASAIWISERYKLSRADRATLAMLAKEQHTVTIAEIKESLREMPRAIVEGRLLLAAVDGILNEALADAIKLARTWEIPAFPVTANDLLSRGFSEGLALGDRLRLLEIHWVQSDYTLSKEALLSELK
jgi:poly(A) polymerase